MPFWEVRNLENELTLPSDAATYSLKLPKQGALSRIILTMQWTGGGTASRAVSIFDAFDLIEVIANGSYVLFSMTPLELFMWSHFFGKTTPVLLRDESADGIHQVIFEIPFSLMNRDRSYYLPLAAYNDVELRVTYSPTISATAGFATGTGLINVDAVITNDLPSDSSVGFLRNRTVNTFTSGASGETRVELVGNFPVLGLGVYVFEDQVLAHTNITDVAVQIRDGARSIVSSDFARLRRQQVKSWGIHAQEQSINFVQDTDDVYYVGDDVNTIVLQPNQGAITIATTEVAHYRLVENNPHHSLISAFSDEPTATHAAQIAEDTDYDVHVQVDYLSIPRGGLIDFALDGQYDNAPVPSANSKMELVLTNGNAGAGVRISQLELAGVVNA